MDNDIVIYKKVHEIDAFLGSDSTLLYQGIHGLHGIYVFEVPDGIRINSGIFGLPPGFDFAARIEEMVMPWKDKFDEQGMVASILLQYERYHVIPLTVVPIIEPYFPIEPHYRNAGCKGFHFVDANREDHPQFRKYQVYSISL